MLSSYVCAVTQAEGIRADAAINPLTQHCARDRNAEIPAPALPGLFGPPEPYDGHSPACP